MMSSICVPVFITPETDLPEVIAAAAETCADMIELRCDTASMASMCKAIRLAHLPVLVTVRPTWEGGFSDKSDMERVEMLIAAAEEGAGMLDIELAAWMRSPEIHKRLASICKRKQDGCGPRLVVSSHDFESKPADLRQRLLMMSTVECADIYKVAYKAHSLLDAIEALALVEEVRREYKHPLVSLAMGEYGQISRLLGQKFGMPFTFAAMNKGAESAPGQPTVDDLRKVYRFEEQGKETAVFGVAGWPVGHSLSPNIHNAGFTSVDFDGVYVPLPIEPSYEAFAQTLDTMRSCKGMNFHGVSVTIPHKENALRYVKERGGDIDELSSRIGVINTIVWKEDTTDRKFYGLNSDYAGAMDALMQAGSLETLAGKRVAVIGAGGVARAMVAGLVHQGATVVLYNRTFEKAQALAEEFNGTKKVGDKKEGGGEGKVVVVKLEKLCDSCCEIFINCTSLGMHPKVEECPVPEDIAWNQKTVVFDTVYNPLETAFLKLAKSKGARTVTGLEMFVRQAAVQFDHFTGHKAPVALFQEIAMEQLNQ